MNKYNSQAFVPEEVKKGLHLKFINFLLEMSSELKDAYFDIHITSDGYCIIVEWADVNLDFQDEDGKFKFVDSGSVIMMEKRFPDDHYELCETEEEYQERLKEFLANNPGWVKTEYGTWTNKIENQKFKEMLENGKSKE